MKEITGAAQLTFDAASGETYRVTYGECCGVDIMNFTDGVIAVSPSGDFSESDGAGSYIYIAAGVAYNDFGGMYAHKNELYVKADGAGKICVVRRE